MPSQEMVLAEVLEPKLSNTHLESFCSSSNEALPFCNAEPVDINQMHSFHNHWLCSWMDTPTAELSISLCYLPAAPSIRYINLCGQEPLPRGPCII